MTDPKGKYFGTLRKEYLKECLGESGCLRSPFEQLRRWLGEASAKNLIEPNAMALATAERDGRPSVRMVLLKTLSEEGLVFFTNYDSRKGRELAENPNAALLFYWSELERQTRVEGKIEKVSAAESDEYFATRPRGARLSAHASKQSARVENREAVEANFREAENKFPGDVPRPANWGGYRLVPTYFEFWQGRENKLHDRLAYELAKNKWTITRLSP